MAFSIQASNPKFLKIFNAEDKSLSDAVESVFPMNTENAVLAWNFISIPLSYKYDISYMLDDIVDLLCALHRQASGEKTIHWLPDTFRSDWAIRWHDGEIEIRAHWECTAGHLERLLNERGTVSLAIADFESEWREVLRVVIRGLENAGYDAERIAGMEELMRQYGRLRRNRLSGDVLEISMKEQELNEKMLLLSIIGTLEAVKDGGLSIRESEQFLFSPYMARYLKRKKYSRAVIDIVEEGCELEDIASLLPESFDRIIGEIKQKALDVLKSYDAFEQEHWI